MPRFSKVEIRASRLSQSIIAIAHQTDDFTLRQTALLLALRGRPAQDATVRGMAAEFDVSRPAITRAMDRLEDAGLAVRLPDPKDGRSVLLTLTPRGFETADDIAVGLS